MKINGNAIRPSMVILHKEKLYKVVKIQHVKPGKGGAYAQVELKDIINGNKLNERFRSDESVERAILEQKECQFSYIDRGFYVFLDNETYEQISINQSTLTEDQLPYMQEGIQVIVEFYEENPISITLPSSIVLEVVETEAVIKGQTVSSSFKPAILNNGVRVMVPQHIETGTQIVVNPQDSTYVERAK